MGSKDERDGTTTGGSWWRRSGGGPRTRSVLLASGLLAVVVAPIGVAATGDALREGQRNGTATRETQIIANVDAGTGTTGGFATRQSNLSESGGGAVYGCRSAAATQGATAPNPCVRANNLANGLAFEFNATEGEAAGRITAGSGGDTKRPFTTNATGVAAGLNADRVDGADAAGLRTRWLLVNERGQIEEQSGGFTIIDAYQTNANVYIDAGSTLENKGLTASIAVQNKIDQGAGPEPEPNFNGEIAVARCQTIAVECAPQGAKNLNAFVVAPRDSDGTVTANGARKRFYVVISE